MPVAIWLAALAIASSLPIAWWAFSGRVEGRAARANLAHAGSVVTDLREAVLAGSAHDRVVSPLMSSLSRRARRFTPAGVVERLEQRAFLAGLSEAWPTERLLAVKAVAAVGLGLVGLLVFGSRPSVLTLLFAIGLFFIGFFSADYVMDSRAGARQKSIERELPDVLDQITICVEAGLGFEAAMAKVSENDGPLSNEIGRTLQDIQIGVPRDQALDRLLSRTDVSDLRTFVHAFNQAERYGIPIAKVLRIQATEMRAKRRVRAEERAMKIPVNIVFPVVLTILPALFVVVAGPAVVRISHISFGG